MTLVGWEQFDVDADVGVRAWGPTRAEAFAQAALGVFALIVSPDEVDEREYREVRAQADSPETLLVNWINECLYVHEIEGFVAHRITVLRVSDTLAHGVVHGEEFDAWRRRLETQGFGQVRERWLARSETIGRRVTVDAVSGVAVGLDVDGALLVDDGRGVQRIVAGEIAPEVDHAARR